MLLIFLLISAHLCLLSSGQLAQCFGRVCEIDGVNGGVKVYNACEPRNNALNVAAMANIEVQPANSTCGRPRVQFCSLKNPISCMTCDASREDSRHDPTHMIDGIKWTWWQSVPFSGPSHRPFEVNITFRLPKVFLLTDDILIDFQDGYPQVMFVEKSSDYGVTWSVLQYFANNCLEHFGIPPTKAHRVFATREEALSPMCTEEFSTNTGADLVGLARVYITARLNALKVIGMNEAAVCDSVHRLNSTLKTFLEITNLRIRLLRPPTLQGARQDTSTKKHYGIKKVHIPARCQCNGHASECIATNSGFKCVCMHNTFGPECQFCKSLFWMKSWRPGSLSSYDVDVGTGNPCLSSFSAYYRRRWSRKDPQGRVIRKPDAPIPEPCECNEHSYRCEIIPSRTTMCVDCRHNTEGQNCHRCRHGYYREIRNGMENLTASCSECMCHRYGSESAWCKVGGQCVCRVNFCGRRCDRCKAGYRLINNECQRFIKPPCEKLCKQTCKERHDQMCAGVKKEKSQNPLKDCKSAKNFYCICKRPNPLDCSSLPSTGEQSGDGGATSIRGSFPYLWLCVFVLLLNMEVCR